MNVHALATQGPARPFQSPPPARGSDAQERAIQLVMYPAAPTRIIAFALIL